MDYISNFLGAQARVPTRRWGTLTFEAVTLSPAIDGDLVAYFGDPLKENRPLVRIHSECVFSEAFGSRICDCTEQRQLALQIMKKERSGIFFYLRFEGRGAGLAAKVKATALEVQGMDTYDSRVAIGVEPESRDFSAIGEFLLQKGVRQIRLLTNNPKKATDLMEYGIDVETVPIFISNPSRDVGELYRTKKGRFGHSIPRWEVAKEQYSLNLDNEEKL